MMDISKFQAVIFDVDGTLYDQRRLRRAVVRRFAAVYSIKWFAGLRAARVLRAYRSAHEELRGCAYSEEMHLDLTAKKSGAPEPEIRELVARWMEAEPLDLLASCVYPGVAKLLQKLAERGIPCGIFSDYPAIDKLKAMKLSQFFTAVSCAAEVGWLKPNPRGLLSVLQSMEVKPDVAIYIGDRQIDSAAAIQAGMKAVLIRNSESYSELLRGFSSRSES
jgi:HAD superfamily hydrolase (TIGR01549 family)